MPSSEISGLTEDTTPDTTDVTYVQDSAGTVDKKVPLSKLPASDATTAAIAAEATLARNADNLTSGTVADARIASTITRDTELTSHAALTTGVHGLTFPAATPIFYIEDGAGGYEPLDANARIYLGTIDPTGGGVANGRDVDYDLYINLGA
jgi:hypothetical protein